jgi:hypothetical protein
MTIFLSSRVLSQDFTYKIKIQGVTNIPEAKLITDPLRFKFKAFPIFNDSTDTFEFNSNVNITQIDLISILTQQGYTLIKLEMSMRGVLTIKEEEK